MATLVDIHLFLSLMAISLKISDLLWLRRGGVLRCCDWKGGRRHFQDQKKVKKGQKQEWGTLLW